MKLSVGKITKRQIIIGRRRESRKLEIENTIGWTSTSKVHKSDKNYDRKSKHKPNYIKD